MRAQDTDGAFYAQAVAEAQQMLARLMAAVDETPAGCWALVRDVAGSMTTETGGRYVPVAGRLMSIRRVLYAGHTGTLDDRPLRRTCGNPSCVNPAHAAPKVRDARVSIGAEELLELALADKTWREHLVDEDGCLRWTGASDDHGRPVAHCGDHQLPVEWLQWTLAHPDSHEDPHAFRTVRSCIHGWCVNGDHLRRVRVIQAPDESVAEAQERGDARDQAAAVAEAPAATRRGGRRRTRRPVLTGADGRDYALTRWRATVLLAAQDLGAQGGNVTRQRLAAALSLRPRQLTQVLAWAEGAGVVERVGPAYRRGPAWPGELDVLAEAAGGAYRRV